jgi:acyl dehydratase
MPLDPSLAGRSYPPSAPYQVGREKIREFASAIGALDPVHHDPAAARARGYRDVVAPPTFPVVLTLLAGQEIVEDLGLDYGRVVHGDQRFRYRRPVVAGDELSYVLVLEQCMSRGGHDMLTLRADVTTTDGELVVEVWSRLVVRGGED